MEPEQEVPLNVLGMWMNAVNTVYQVSATDMRYIWDERTYSLPAYNVQFILSSAGDTEHDPPNLQTRFVIWTIQRLMFHCWVTRSWKRTVGFPVWQGQSVGVVQIWSPDPASLITGQRGNNTEDIVNTPIPTNNSVNSTGSSSSNNNANLQLIFRFGATRLDSSHIFLTALEGLAKAAEEGLTARCEKMFVRGNGVIFFELRSMTDVSGDVLLRFGYVRQVLKQSIDHMLLKRRFAELYLKVQIDGRDIAEGSWQRWNPDLRNATAEQ